MKKTYQGALPSSTVMFPPRTVVGHGTVMPLSPLPTGQVAVPDLSSGYHPIITDLGLTCATYRALPRWKRLQLLQQLPFIRSSVDAIRADGGIFSYCTRVLAAKQASTDQQPMQLASLAIGLLVVGGVWFLLTSRKAHPYDITSYHVYR